LKRKLDEYIVEEREKKLTLSSSMPVPNRFLIGEVSNLTLSRMGEMSFHAQSDKHDFHVGVMRKTAAREALKKGGFIA